MSKTIKLDPFTPQEKKIDDVAKVLYAGGIIGYPTETIYGIGCSAYNNSAVQRIYDLKGRDQSKAMILIAADLLQVQELVKSIPDAAEKLMESFWPGPLTMVFEASEKLHQYAIKSSKTIAIRIPACPICLSLLKSCDFPIVSTSANKSGSAPAITAQEVETVFGDQLDLIIDGGSTPSNAPSTVVDVTRSPIKIIREGAISELEINTAL
jgi:L-threonylcarbamoyladenylate synthase